MTDLTGTLNEGDRFRFEAITVTARKIGKPQKIQNTKTHRSQRIKCSGNGIVIVDKPWVVSGDIRND